MGSEFFGSVKNQRSNGTKMKWFEITRILDLKTRFLNFGSTMSDTSQRWQIVFFFIVLDLVLHGALS